MDYDTELINTLRGEELFKAVTGLTTHFMAEFYGANPDSKASLSGSDHPSDDPFCRPDNHDHRFPHMLSKQKLNKIFTKKH